MKLFKIFMMIITLLSLCVCTIQAQGIKSILENIDSVEIIVNQLNEQQSALDYE